MKTHIIQLDELDDSVSVRDKMSWGRAKRLLLVYPPKARILPRTLDLLLLKRHAVSLGAHLALVTRSPAVRRAAQAVGLPVFGEAAEAQRFRWPKPDPGPRARRSGPPPDFRRWRADLREPESAWQAQPWVRLAIFSTAVLAVLVLLLVFVPSAEVRLDLVTEPQSLTLHMRASPEASTINLAGVVPSRMATLVVGGSRSVAINSYSDVPDDPAVGTVVFRNLTSEVVGVPAGTIVRTPDESSQRFVTTVDGVLEAEVGAMVELPVQALRGGTGGNLPADVLVAIEGGLGTDLAVTNPRPMTGGTDRLTSVPSDADRGELYADLLTDLHTQALEQFESSLTPGDLIFIDTFAVSQILAESYTPAAGQPGRQLTLTLQLEFRVNYASGDDLASLALASLDAALPDGFMGSAGSLVLTQMGEPITGGDGTTLWQMRARREIHARVEPVQVADLVQGRTRRGATRSLQEALALDAPPEFRLRPSWWPFLPLPQFLIGVEY
ncbi:MAG: baseplate J/gp47 family protein [Anaerolineales bacterium]|nr:baseplate J/gp47 family protein [Anaerolineales bacterium]